MKKLSILSIIGLALLTLPLALWAQEDERAPLSDVWLVMPKQGMAMQFEDAAKTHMAFRADAGDSRDWEAYAAAIGKNPQLYQWRAGGLNWADMDAYTTEDQENGYGDHWFANVDQYVDHYHHYMERADFENSHWPADLGQHPYYAVTSWTMKQGAGPGPDEARKQLSKIAMDEGWTDMGNNWLWLNRIGGTPTLMIVSELDDYADMEPPEQSFFEFVSEKLDSEEEAGKIFAQFSAGFSDSNLTVWAHRPDLSSPSESGSDDD